VVLRRDTGSTGTQTVEVRVAVGCKVGELLMHLRPARADLWDLGWVPEQLEPLLRPGAGAGADQRGAWFAAGTGGPGVTVKAVERTVA
jgi:hypothetical protein